MKALVAKTYGPPEDLSIEELPQPQPGPGQILVRIAAASLNPGELRLVSGEFDGRLPVTFPHVLGHDFAGTVTALGAGVMRFGIGDEVFGFAAPKDFPYAEHICKPPSIGTGTMAEYAVFQADTPAIERRPAGLSAEAAATLPTAGLTAWVVLREAAIRPGDTALVIGATGGVGAFAVPLLAAAKARVIATAGPADRERVLALGADTVLDHTAGDVIAQTLDAFPDGVNAVVNLALPAGQLAGTARAAATGGRLVTITGLEPSPVPERPDLAVSAASTQLEAGDLAELARRVVDGELPLSITGRYSLADAPAAYTALLREHTAGKLVVNVA